MRHKNWYFKMAIVIFFGLLFSLLQLQPSLSASQKLNTNTNESDHVILIDWDGFSPDYMDLADTPNLDLLIENGNYSVAKGTYQTMSNSVRASMSTGANPEVHGNKSYYFDHETNKTVGQTRHLEAETIAEALADEGKTIASVQWYMIQNHGVEFGNPEQLYIQPGGTFEEHADAAIDIINKRPVNSQGSEVTVPEIPSFLAVYSSHLDSFGHDQGPKGSKIIPEVEELDHHLGRIIEATKEVGIYDSTTFIVTSDHGMTSQDRSINDDVLKSIEEAGFSPEIVPVGQSPADESDVIITPAVRIANITLRDDAATNDAKQLIENALKNVDNMANVHNERDLKSMKAHPGVGQLVIEAAEPWGFSLSDRPEDSPRGGHGSLAEIEVPLIISGAGIQGGTTPNDAKLIDLAPTIATLLDNRIPADAQGRVLNEILMKQEIDMAELEQLITDAKSISKDKYTESSYQSLQDAIKTAEEALETIDSEKELNTFIAGLQKAINSLEKVETNPDPEINVSELEQLITDAKRISKDKYTESSYQTLQDSIKVAEKALETIDSEEELGIVIGGLQSALDDLQVKGTDSKKGDKLPKTSTSMFNFLLIGVILFTIGGLLYFRNRRQA